MVGVITDNGANIVRTVGNSFGKNKHLPCFAHTLNLVASKVVEDTVCRTVIEKVKNIVKFFKQSVTASDILKKSQPNEQTLKLKQSVATRWNSCFYMLYIYILYVFRCIGTIYSLNTLAKS